MGKKTTIKRRVYVSLPADRWVPKNLNRLKWAIVNKIRRLGYVPEIFTNPRGGPGLASALAWHPRDADDIARRCTGAVILGMQRWSFKDGRGNQILLPTEFNHYEGALARTLRLPTLVLVQCGVLRRVVFDMNFSGFIGEFDAHADVPWLQSEAFRVPFNYWQDLLEERRDLFLGYSSASEEVAKTVKRHLQRQLGARVLDWQTDFIPGRTILEQIEQAAARSVGGIFLFTKDDDLAAGKKDIPAGKKGVLAVPRDNVVFEAGYFIAMKGKRNVLIIRQEGSKMPADLGGDIYASLRDKRSIEPIKETLKAFMTAI